MIMKTKVNLFHARCICAVALGIGPSSGLAAASGQEVGSVERGALKRQGVEPPLHAPRSDTPRLAWSQIGAKAGADYQGDGLAVSPTPEGARLHCVFQRLEGEATREGLWLTSTLTNGVKDLFRVTAVEVGRQPLVPGVEVAPRRGSSVRSAMFIADVPGDSQAPLGTACDDERSAHRPVPLLTELERDSVGWPFYKHGAPNGAFAQAGQCEVSGLNGCAIAKTGIISLAGQVVRFTRPGLVEEYSVSMDGVRQDFIIEHPPLNLPVLRSPPGEGGSTLRSTATEDGSTLNQRPGELAVRLAVSGAKVEPAAGGARLVLPNSRRKIAYSRLRVTDATGKELAARIEVIGHGESQRDSITQPRVASPRATLGSGEEGANNPERVASDGRPSYAQQYDATPLGLAGDPNAFPRVARGSQPLYVIQYVLWLRCLGVPSCSDLP